MYHTKEHFLLKLIFPYRKDVPKTKNKARTEESELHRWFFFQYSCGFRTSHSRLLRHTHPRMHDVYTHTQHNNNKNSRYLYSTFCHFAMPLSACCMSSFSNTLNVFMGRTWFIRWFIGINMCTYVAGRQSGIHSLALFLTLTVCLVSCLLRNSVINSNFGHIKLYRNNQREMRWNIQYLNDNNGNNNK